MMQASEVLIYLFVGLSLICLGMFLSAVAASARRVGLEVSRRRRQFGVITLLSFGWMGLTYGLASAGVLEFGTMPPKLPILIFGAFGLVFYIGYSRLGTQLTALPFTWLIGFQSFRVAVELLLHRAYIENIMPIQMSYEGYNFDILSGISALLVLFVGLKRGEIPRGLIVAWNIFACVLLAIILSIAILSMPVEAVRMFQNEPANEWIAQAPFIWLPTVMVFIAVLGHILVFRKLKTSAT